MSLPYAVSVMGDTESAVPLDGVASCPPTTGPPEIAELYNRSTPYVIDWTGALKRENRGVAASLLLPAMSPPTSVVFFVLPPARDLRGGFLRADAALDGTPPPGANPFGV